MSVSRDDYTKAFSRRLKAIITNSGEPTKSIADKADIHYCSLNEYENGKALPSAFVLAKIVIALGVDANVLLGTTRAVRR